MKSIHKEVLVNAHRSEVWNDWTNADRISTFFAPQAAIDLEIGGRFEMYFMLNNPAGLRGSEDCKILSFIPEKMLSFSWNAPPHLPNVRKEKTWVVIDFIEISDYHTKINLTHLGWKEGEEWDACYAYFEEAWASVLSNLEVKYARSTA